MEERERLIPEYAHAERRLDWGWVGVNVLAWVWPLLLLGVLYWIALWFDD